MALPDPRPQGSRRVPDSAAGLCLLAPWLGYHRLPDGFLTAPPLTAEQALRWLAVLLAVAAVIVAAIVSDRRIKAYYASRYGHLGVANDGWAQPWRMNAAFLSPWAWDRWLLMVVCAGVIAFTVRHWRRGPGLVPSQLVALLAFLG